MGRYYLNGVDLSVFGFIPGHASGSNIALSGAWSLPKRLGDCYHDWPEIKGVEPYVENVDIRFAGRDLSLYGYIVGDSWEKFIENTDEFFSAILQYQDLVELKSDFGIYNVYVKDAIRLDNKGNGRGEIILKFREPIVDITGVVPDGKSTIGDGIEGMTYKSLGLTVLKSTYLDRPVIKAQNHTSWEKEGYRVTKPKVGTLELEMLLEADDYSGFLRMVQQCYYLFGGSGVRDIVINGDAATYFCVNGFSVDDIIIQERVYANFKVKLLDGYILNEHILCDDDTDIAIGDDDELIIAYHG